MAKTNSSRTPTRCKPGDRARIIWARNHSNIGKVVVVVRPYAAGEVLNGSTWTVDATPCWVAVSLCGPFLIFDESGRSYACDTTAVLYDSQLMPLRDDEGGVEDLVACGLTQGGLQ